MNRFRTILSSPADPHGGERRSARNGFASPRRSLREREGIGSERLCAPRGTLPERAFFEMSRSKGKEWRRGADKSIVRRIRSLIVAAQGSPERVGLPLFEEDGRWVRCFRFFPHGGEEAAAMSRIDKWARIIVLVLRHATGVHPKGWALRRLWASLGTGHGRRGRSGDPALLVVSIVAIGPAAP